MRTQEILVISYFNSQPHKEADDMRTQEILVISYFNSQPHKEADYITMYLGIIAHLFQLTASQGG